MKGVCIGVRERRGRTRKKEKFLDRVDSKKVSFQ